MEQLIQLFDLGKCSRNGARFDYVKAAWVNHQYLVNQPDEAWVPALQKILGENGIVSTPEKMAEVVRVMKLKD